MSNGFDEDWFSGKGSSKNFTSRAIADLRKKREEEAYNAEVLKGKQEEQQKKEQKKRDAQKSLLDRAGDVAGGVGNFIKDVGVGVKDDAVNAYTGIKDAIEGSVATNKQLDKTNEYIKKQKEITDKIYKIVGDRTDDAAWNDPKVKDLRNQMNRLALENGQGGGLTEQQKKDSGYDTKKRDTALKDIANTNKEFKEAQKVDAKKTAFAAASTFLNATGVYALGAGVAKTAAVQGSKAVSTQLTKQTITQMVKTGGTESLEQIIKSGSKEAAEQAVKDVTKVAGKEVADNLLKQAVKKAAPEALLGSGYGVVQTGTNNPDATAGDYLKGAAIGFGVGGALPIAGAGAKKLVTSKPVQAMEEMISNTASKAVAKAGETKAGQAVSQVVGDVTEKVQQAFVDTLAPVKRDFKGLIDKTTGRQVNEEVRMLQGNVTNSSAIAAGRRAKNSAWQELSDLLAPDKTVPGSRRAARKEAQSLGEFINAKQDAINAEKLGKKAVPIPVGTPKQEKAYQLLNQATKDDIQYAYDNNLITKANYEKYMGDANYTRVQRDMEGEIQRNFKGAGGPDASISSTPFQQRLKGDGGKKAIDPFVAYRDWSEKVTKAGERQKLSDYVIKQREAHGLGGGYLREADSVEARLAARGEAAQLRVLRNGLARAVSSESRYGRRLQAELDKLNKQGLNVALKKGGQEAMPEFSVKGLGGELPTGKTPKTGTTFIADENGVVRGNTEKQIQTLSKQRDNAMAKVEKMLGKAPKKGEGGLIPVKGNEEAMAAARKANNAQQKINKIIKQTGGDTQFDPTHSPQLGKSDTKRFIKNLIDAPISDLEKIKRKIATREPKLAAHIDTIIGLKNEHEIVSKTVRELNDLARSYADKNMVGKNTIKTFKRGIKEVWEDEPRIVNAINRVGKIEMHALLRIAQAPSRVVQRTATALNFAFGIKNYGRDQLSSAILSKSIRATHNPVSFMMGLKEAALKPTGKAILRGVGARDTAEKVLNPSKEYQAFLKYVSGQTQVNITQSLKKSARATYEELGLKGESLIRKVENANAATENATRFQNFYGILKSETKKGTDYETALKKAIQAGREHSVDFSQSGDWSPFMKIINPFANANIQGSRSLVRAFKERPIATSMKVGVTLYTPVALATYHNLSDPKKALIYSALPESTREGNLIFITSGGDVVKLPLPPGAKELAQPVRRMVEAEYGLGDKETFAKTAKSLFVDSVNPFGATDLVPQATKPIVENTTNFSLFNKKPIVPDYMKENAPADQKFASTGQTYQDLGAATGTSPLMVKNLVKGYGGPTVEQGVAYFDKLRQKVNPNVVAEDRTTVDQLKGAYYEPKPDLQQKANNLFYDKYNKLSKQRQSIASDIKELRAEGKINESNRKAAEYNKTLQNQFTGIEKYGWDKDWDKMLVRLFIKPVEK